MIPDHLRIQPGQEVLTPEQEATARRFAQERIAAQLSTEPVDESEAEYWLRLACQQGGVLPPHEVIWLESPLQLLWLWLPSNVQPFMWARVRNRVQARRWARVRSLPVSIEENGVPGWGTCVSGQRHLVFSYPLWYEEPDLDVAEQVQEQVRAIIQGSLLWQLERRIGHLVAEEIVESQRDVIRQGGVLPVEIAGPITRAYRDAREVAFHRFFDEYLAANASSALAHLLERLSCSWLSKRGALLIRRPQVLALDAEGRLHSATGKCLEYRDGWGIYAWHGVRVPEKVILAPERLSRQDFLSAPNVEVRRVIQERMGSRFVTELGGVVIDSSPRWTLFEVGLGDDDPERVARYVQVRDASTERQYFLRVPPTIQTTDEAVAWTFQVGAEDYCPTQET